jgi:hypothetical protein
MNKSDRPPGSQAVAAVPHGEPIVETVVSAAAEDKLAVLVEADDELAVAEKKLVVRLAGLEVVLQSVARVLVVEDQTTIEQAMGKVALRATLEGEAVELALCCWQRAWLRLQAADCLEYAWRVREWSSW